MATMRKSNLKVVLESCERTKRKIEKYAPGWTAQVTLVPSGVGVPSCGKSRECPNCNAGKFVDGKCSFCGVLESEWPE